MPRPVERSRGFTLMVLGLLNLAGESVRTAVAVEERALADVVADNQAVEAALLPAGQLGGPATGVESTGDRRWRWVRNSRVEDGLLRVDIQVLAADSGQLLAERQLLRAMSP